MPPELHFDPSGLDFNRVVVIQERLVSRQQTLAESQGQIALGLIRVYRALGGGWQIRCGPNGAIAHGGADAREPTLLPAVHMARPQPMNPSPVPIATNGLIQGKQ